MGDTEKHHYLQRKKQKDIFGDVIDDRTIELPKRYQRKKINPLQRKGVGT